MSRAFSFEEKRSRGDRPKRQAPDCGDHCQSHEQHALTIALWTQTYSPTTHRRLVHDAGALSDHNTPRVETTNAHPTRWTVDRPSKANIEARCRTSHLVRCFEVGSSGNKNLNRFRFAIGCGRAKRGPSVLQKNTKKRKGWRWETEKRSCVSDIELCHNQPGGATPTDPSGHYPTACQERFPLRRNAAGETDPSARLR
jgi:hypothetical protein